MSKDFCTHGTGLLKDPLQGSIESLEANVRHTIDELQTTLRLANPVESIVTLQISAKLNEAYGLILQLKSARNAQHASST